MTLELQDTEARYLRKLTLFPLIVKRHKNRTSPVFKLLHNMLSAVDAAIAFHKKMEPLINSDNE